MTTDSHWSVGPYHQSLHSLFSDRPFLWTNAKVNAACAFRGWPSCFHPLHLATVPGKHSLPLSFLSFANEVINKAGVGQAVRNGATVAGVNARHQSWEPKWKINDFVCCLFGWLFGSGRSPVKWCAQIIFLVCFYYIFNFHLQMIDGDYCLCHSFLSGSLQSSSHIDLWERNLLLKLNEEIATGNARVQSQGLFNSLLIWRILEER